MTIRYRTEVSPGVWSRTRKEDGSYIVCEEDCCDQSNDPCTPSEQTFLECVDEGVALNDCFDYVYASIDIDFGDRAGNNWSQASGTYFVGKPFDVTDQEAFNDQLRGALARAATGASFTFCDFTVNFVCVSETFEVNFGQIDNPTCPDGTWGASYSDPMPVTLTSGDSFDLTPFGEAVSGGDSSFPTINSATVKLYGVLCSELPEDCSFPPEVEWRVKRVSVGASGCETSGCTAYITVDSHDGFCDTQYFWSDGNTEGKNREIIDLPDCGTYEYTLFAIDARGCVSSKTIEITCSCECTGPIPFLSFGIPDNGSYGGPGDCIYDFAWASGPNPDCPTGFWEICHLTGGIVCPPNEDDCGECDEEGVATPCTCCSFLGNDQTLIFSNLDWSIAHCFRYRYWDRACGCASPWQYSQFQNGDGCTTEFPECVDPEL